MLKIEALSLAVPTREGLVEAVSRVSMTVRSGEVLGLVGESGCGKTLCAQAILRLGETSGVQRLSGRIFVDGTDVFTLDEPSLRKVRGGKVGMIFQEPMTALNPVFSIGSQITEVIRIHLGLNKQAAEERAIDLLTEVGLKDARSLLRRYPNELSGGMRQRVLIAMALAGNPNYLVADEPTTALDVSVQARIIRLLQRLQRQKNLGMLLVTHDFGLVAEMADKVAVMYAGQIVEFGPVDCIFDRPAHPYTQALLACRPEISPPGKPLPAIPGQVPPPGRWPQGCRFADRCPFATKKCANPIPEEAWRDGEHRARCIYSEALIDLRRGVYAPA